MAKDKDSTRAINPATAALKASKQRSINKQKAAQQQQRNERLLQRNPNTLKRQVEELQQQREASGGVLNARDRKRLEELERDLGRLERVRDKAGDKRDGEREDKDKESRGAGGRRDVRKEQMERRQGILGKRSRDDNSSNSNSNSNSNNNDNETKQDVNGFRSRNANKRQRTPESSTDDDAKSIPMPQDVENMPPIPRKPRPVHDLPGRPGRPGRPGAGDSTIIPGQGEVPPLPAQTVYSSAPQLRNLQQEAVSRFVPAAVATKLAAVRGEGAKLLEPEEADALEAAGYRTGTLPPKPSRGVAEPAHAEMQSLVGKVADEAEKELEYNLMAREALEGQVDTLEEETRRFEQEVRGVEMQEVSDEDL